MRFIQQKCVRAGLRLSPFAACLTLALGGLAFAQVAIAQDASAPASASSAPDKAKNLQQITVTGSNIRSVDVADAQPLITISAADIQRQGFATVGQILQNVSAAATPDLSTSAPGDLGPNQGGQFINLRGLGAPRTLVLLNGQRIGAAHGGYTNINVIPASVIDRIEVLATGASAVYGSDAIAGVVNIITRKDFNGVQIDTYNGMYAPHSDGNQNQYSVTAGKSGDRGGIVISASYQKQDPVWAGDRSFSSYPWTDRHPYYGLSYTKPNGLITNAPGGRVVLNPGGDSRNIADYSPFVAQKYNGAGDIGSLADAGSYTYNTNSGQQTMLRTADTTKNLYIDAHLNLTSNLTAKFNYGYNIDREYAQSGYSTLYSGMGSNLAYPSTLDPNSYYNPLPGQATKFYRRMADLQYANQSYNNPTNYRYSLGLEGNFNIGDDHTFNWDVYHYDSKIKGINTRPGYFDLVKVQQGLGPSFMGSDGNVHCGTPGNVIAGCVPINPLAGPGGFTKQMLDYLAISSVERYGSREQATAADITGNLFPLPGGDLTFATGIQHRRVSGYDDPDAYAQQGLSSDGGVLSNSGEYSLNEAYVELNAPLLKDLPGAQSLSLDVARRHSDYSNFGITNNNAFKLTWQPIEDLLVRASYGTGFRAPTVNDLYQGRYPAGTFTDPCDAMYGPGAYGNNATVAQRCLSGYGGIAGVPADFRQVDVSGQPITSASGSGAVPTTNFTGGNVNLKPETSYNSQFGFVYSPSWLQGFNLSVDYWRYNIRNLITGIGNDQVLANCYQYGMTDACGQFQRQPGTGQIYNLLNLETNAGWQKTSGYDFSVAYALPEYSFGRFKANLSGTYVSRFDTLPTIGSAVVNGAGISSNITATSVWRLRGNLTLNWEWRDFGASWTMRYFSPLKAPCAFTDGRSAFPCSLPDYYAAGVGTQPMTQIGSVTFHDLQLYWNAPWKGTISVGANNLFNRVGPYVYGGYAGSDTPYNYNASYDIGRYVYVRYQQRF